MSKAACVQKLEKAALKEKVPEFNIGDTVKVHVRIIEGTKERVQVYQGTVISRQGAGLAETFSVHRVAYGEGMERTFLIHSPRVAKIEVVRRGHVRRAKLYYLRGKKGKKAKVKGSLATNLKKEPAQKAAPVQEPEAPKATEESSK